MHAQQAPGPEYNSCYHKKKLKKNKSDFHHKKAVVRVEMIKIELRYRLWRNKMNRKDGLRAPQEGSYLQLFWPQNGRNERFCFK